MDLAYDQLDTLFNKEYGALYEHMTSLGALMLILDRAWQRSCGVYAGRARSEALPEQAGTRPRRSATSSSRSRATAWRPVTKAWARWPTTRPASA